MHIAHAKIVVYLKHFDLEMFVALVCWVFAKEKVK
jgi:hypothetical protein